MPEDVVVATPAATPAAPVPRETPAASAPPAPADSDAQNTGAEATPAQPDAKPEAAPTPEQVAKRHQNRLDRKLDKAFRERAEAQARAEFAEKRLAETQRPQADPGMPKIEQYDYDPEKYAKAVADYTKASTEREIQAKAHADNRKRYIANLAAEWDAKVEKSADKYDDYTQVVGTVAPTSHFAEALMEAENGPDIAYHLGKNLKEAQRIAALHPLAQAREIGILQERLSAQPPKAKTPSDAPAPIKPVGGNGSPSTRPLRDLPQDEFEKRRRQQIAARR